MAKTLVLKSECDEKLAEIELDLYLRIKLKRYKNRSSCYPTVFTAEECRGLAKLLIEAADWRDKMEEHFLSGN